MAQPWIRRYKPEWGFELFRWADLDPEEIERLKASYQESGWIAEDLRPWHYDASTLEPGSSLGIRYRGEIVGWVINHRLDARTVRFTCSFLRRDLARFARILPAYSESVRRAHDAGFEQVVFTVPVHHREMVSFVRRRCLPNGAELSETRGASKALAVPPRLAIVTERCAAHGTFPEPQPRGLT